MYTNIILKEGDTGDAVTYLQQMLRITGYYPISITGVFGPDTTGFVLSFQQDNNLNMNGIIDSDDWEVLEKLAEPDKINFNVLSKPTLKLGDTGVYVTEIQTKLKELDYYNGIINGTYDNNTYEAVKAYQFVNKLSPDGVVGTNTWSSLETLYQPLAACGDDDSDNSGDNKYIVVSGDTLYSIARKFNTTVNTLKKLNNLTSDTLSIGQVLIVSEDDSNTTTPDTSYNTYTVVSGDTLYSIARKFNTTVSNLKTLNNLTSDTLSIGQVLIVSEDDSNTTTPDTSYDTYTVVSGDTLYSIARKFNTTVSNLKTLNNLTSDTLSIGQILKISITPTDPNITYIVKAGDTLYKIATQYQTSVADIMEKNNLTSSILSIGQVLII